MNRPVTNNRRNRVFNRHPVPGFRRTNEWRTVRLRDRSNRGQRLPTPARFITLPLPTTCHHKLPPSITRAIFRFIVTNCRIVNKVNIDNSYFDSAVNAHLRSTDKSSVSINLSYFLRPFTLRFFLSRRFPSVPSAFGVLRPGPSHDAPDRFSIVTVQRNYLIGLFCLIVPTEMAEYAEYQQNSLDDVLHFNYGVELFPNMYPNLIAKKKANSRDEAISKLKTLLRNNGFAFLAGKLYS